MCPSSVKTDSQGNDVYLQAQVLSTVNISFRASLATCLSLIPSPWNFSSWNIKICLCLPIFRAASPKGSVCIIHQKKTKWLCVSSLCWDPWKEGSGGCFGVWACLWSAETCQWSHFYLSFAFVILCVASKNYQQEIRTQISNGCQRKYPEEELHG